MPFFRGSSRRISNIAQSRFGGYLALILGCGLAIVQVLALISPRRLYLPVFFLIVALAAYLIYIGRRSIAEARRSEPRLAAVTLSAEIRELWAQCRIRTPVLRTRLAAVGITKETFLITLGLVQATAGVLALLYVGSVLLAGAGYLGIGPGAVPVLVFCLFGVIAGIAMVVRPSGGARYAAAIWDVVVGLFVLLAALTGSQFHPARFLVAAILLGMFTVLISPNAAER